VNVLVVWRRHARTSTGSADVERISPEAPVPVVRVQRREERLGGAANVARNIASLGVAHTAAA